MLNPETRDFIVAQARDIAEHLNSAWSDDKTLRRFIPYAALYYAGAKTRDWLDANLPPDAARAIITLR